MSYFYENYRQQRVTPPNVPWARTSRHPPPVQPIHAYQTISQKIFYQRHLSYGGCPQGYSMAPRPQYWNPYMAATQQYSFRTAAFSPGPNSAEYSAYARPYYPTPPQYFSRPPPASIAIRPMQQRTLPPQVPRVQSRGPPRMESKQPPSPCQIRIRDPNQGGRDITEEIMSGVGWSTATFTPAPRPEEQVDKLAFEASPTQVSHLPEPPGKPLAEPPAEATDDETWAQNDNEQNREADRAEAAPECDLASEHPAEPPLELSAGPLADFTNETWAEYEIKQTTESDAPKAAFVRVHDSGACFTLTDPSLKLPAEPLTELPAADKVGGMQSRDKQNTELNGPEAAPPRKPAPEPASELPTKPPAVVAHAIMAWIDYEPNTETDWDEGAPAHEPASGPLSTQAIPTEEPAPESATEPPAEVTDKTWEEIWEKQTTRKYTDESASAPAGQKMPPDLVERKRCDVDFLPSLQNSTCAQKPKDLVRISRAVNETRPEQADRAGWLNADPDFSPWYLKNHGSTPGEGSKPLASSLKNGVHTFHPNGTQKGVRKEPRKFTPAASTDNKVQLNKAEHAWRPSPGASARGRGAQEATDDDPEQVKTQQLFKRLRSILNKLTPQKFDELMKQVKELTIDTTERLKGAIDLIFEKAISEPNFSVPYASMCSYLTKLNSPTADKRGVNVKFHKVLLNRCQEEFERDRDNDEMLKKKQNGLEAAKDDEERERLTLELEAARYKARRRSIGNMKFIGELFKLNIITASIMGGCIQKLLRNGDEESLECLSTLLSTTGKNLDKKDGKPRMDRNFNQIETIIKKRKTSSRVRFMLQDLVDLRKNKWVPRREDQGPKTIDQIHKEAKMEEQKVHQQLLAMEEEEDMTSRSVRGRGCRTPEDPRTSQAQTVGRNTMNRPINIALLRATFAQDVNTLELATGGKRDWMCRWDKGCSGGQEKKGCGKSKTSSFNHFPNSDDKVTQRSSSDQNYCDERERTDRRRDWLGGFDTRNSTEPQRHDASTTTEPERKGWDPGSEDYPPLVDLTVKPRRTPASTCPPKPALSVEEVERKSTAIIAEYLCLNNFKDTLQSVTELQSASLLSVFVRHTVETALDRSSVERERVGLLLHYLVKAGTLPAQQYYKGLEETLEAAEDIAIDVPHIWRYLAEIITPMLREGGIPVGQLFREITKPLMHLGKAGILLAEILKLRRKEKSPEKVGDMWTDAGMRCSHFLPDDWAKNQPIVMSQRSLRPY